MAFIPFSILVYEPHLVVIGYVLEVGAEESGVAIVVMVVRVLLLIQRHHVVGTYRIGTNIHRHKSLLEHSETNRSTKKDKTFLQTKHYTGFILNSFEFKCSILEPGSGSSVEG